jgi:hypothetical protein
MQINPEKELYGSLDALATLSMTLRSKTGRGLGGLGKIQIQRSEVSSFPQLMKTKSSTLAWLALIRRRKQIAPIHSFLPIPSK